MFLVPYLEALKSVSLFLSGTGCVLLVPCLLPVIKSTKNSLLYCQVVSHYMGPLVCLLALFSLGIWVVLSLQLL